MIVDYSHSNVNEYDLMIICHHYNFIGKIKYKSDYSSILSTFDELFDKYWKTIKFNPNSNELF